METRADIMPTLKKKKKRYDYEKRFFSPDGSEMLLRMLLSSPWTLLMSAAVNSWIEPFG